MKWYNNRLDELISFWSLWMNWIEINIYLKSSISLQINIVNNLIRNNYDHYLDTILIITNNDLLCWFMCKKCNCRQENNLIVSSSVDAKNEDWTGSFGWQPRIGEVKYQILSWWTVLPATWGCPSNFQTELDNKIS